MKFIISPLIAIIASLSCNSKVPESEIGIDTKAGSAIVAKLEPAAAKLAQSNVVSKVSQVGSKIIKETGVKLSKVEKSLEKVKVGDKFTKITETKPGIGPGQSRAVYERVKNADGTVIRNTKTSYDRANKVQNIKPKELPKN